jgi:hypothetical protein
MPFECHLGVLILDVIMLSAVLLVVVMLNVVKLVAIMLNVMAPQIFFALFGETDLIPIRVRATSNVSLGLGFQL